MASALARGDGQMLADPLSVANDGVLPTDVFYEVLLRVPAKALCRLRLVCRSWRSLTYGQSFARAHSARHPVFVALQLQPDGDEIHIVDLSGNIVKRIRGYRDDLFSHMSLQAGLVYVSTIALSDNGVDPAHLNEQDGLVLNPATGAVSILPDGNRSSSALASTYILGHVPSTGVYKVIHLSRDTTGQGLGLDCEVVTLGGGDQRWRAKPSPMNSSVKFWVIETVHGVTFFLFSEASANDHSCSSMVPTIALFDLTTEEWRPTFLQSPLSSDLFYSKENVEHYEQDLDLIRFAILNECLVTIHHKCRDWSTDLWFLMDMDNESFWTKRYSMSSVPHWCWEHYASYYHPCPLVVLDDGRIVIWLEQQFILRSYDLRTQSWANLATLGDYYAIGMLQESLLGSDLQGRFPLSDNI